MMEIEKINNISINNTIISGYIYKTCNESIPVKIVTYYNITLNDIIEYLNINNNNITFGKERFTLEIVKAYDINNNSYEGYIIT
tara:strand:- start:14 stop:265 length:252 start_codon:yes stop_codon:yes gene_type:complete